MFWLFDTFSYKSYLLLPRDLREYWPRRAQPTPPDIAAFPDRLAQQRHGANWRPETGVASRSGRKHLLPGAAPLDAAALADPDVRFFDQVNPGHRAGDRLVCLAPLSDGQSDRGDRPNVEVLIAQPALQAPLHRLWDRKPTPNVKFSANKTRSNVYHSSPACIIPWVVNILFGDDDGKTSFE